MSRLGMPGGTAGARARCLGDRLTAYADRAMDPASLLHWDRHLVACTRCRAEVEEERRVLAALRSPSSVVPRDLRSMLLAVAAEHGSCTPTPPQRGGRGHALPPIPAAPVPVVDRGAPALHRSARRATVFAGLAAGATAAAAWGLAVTAGSSGLPNQPVSPAVQRTRPATPGFANAAFTARGLGANPAVQSSRATVGPAVGVARLGSAQSTP